jgi:Protein of unknown function (DUF2924)
MKRHLAKNSTNVADLMKEIIALPRAELIERWSKHHGHPPPKAISTRLLVYSIAYAVQAEAYGGLSKSSQKQLVNLANSTKPSHASHISKCRAPSFRMGATPSQGTKFVRDWNGRTHVVEVIDNGFLWQGKIHRSLTAIAFSITGSHWSGPRFFGVT